MTWYEYIPCILIGALFGIAFLAFKHGTVETGGIFDLSRTYNDRDF